MSLEFDANKEKNDILDEGDFILEVVGYDRWETDAGKPAISITSKVLKGEFKGKKHKQSYFIVKGAKWRFAQFMDACGRGDANVDLDDVEAMLELFVGDRYKASCKHKEWEGRTFAELNNPEQLTDAEKDSVSDIQRSKPSEKSAEESKSFYEQSYVKDDDIPF